VLALYFARALRRSDYALARIAGFGLGLLLLLLFPITILLIGRVLLSTDVGAALAEDLPQLPAVVAQGLVITGLFGSLAMAVSAFTPRRAYATAGIIALFVIPGIIASAVIAQGSGALGVVLVLLSPGTILDGTSGLFFGTGLPEDLFFFDLPIWTFLASAILLTIVAVLVCIRRFVRFAT
jgi:ABC-2 type transport system permease protein